jgi:hypothetical protein
VKRRRALFIDVVSNLVLPWLLLTYGSGDEAFGPRLAPAVAMIAPLLNALWRRVQRGRANPLSGLVIASLAANAAIGFFPVQAVWFAVKEAVVPVVLGGAIAATAWRGPGLVASMLEELIDPAKLQGAIAARSAEPAFAASARQGTFGFAAITAASGLTSGALSLWFIHAPSGTTAFAEELGRYTGWSFAAVTLPTMALSMFVFQRVMRGIESAIGQSLDGLMSEG